MRSHTRYHRGEKFLIPFLFKICRGNLTQVETGTDSSWPVELCTVVLKPKLITQVQPKGIDQIERYFFKDAHMRNVASMFEHNVVRGTSVEISIMRVLKLLRSQ